jgi:hypothetical protein
MIMSDRMHVATRKGLLTFVRGSGSWKIQQRSFLGDPVSNILQDARDGTLYAALDLGHFGAKLRRSSDGGETWEEVSVPGFPKDPEEEATQESKGKAPSLKQIWSLETGGADQPGLLWAGCIPAGLFRSENRGESWDLVTSMWDRPERHGWFGGGTDAPGLHSILVDPRDSTKITIGISVGGVWHSNDMGETWNLHAKGMRAAYMPPEKEHDQNIQDPHRLVRCLAQPDTLWCQHHNGVFKSTDNGANWQEITTTKPSNFGFGVVVHPADPDRAWLVPGVKDECRMPVDSKLVVSHTQDGGKSWKLYDDGLPTEHAYDIIYRHAFDIDATGDTLAMGSTTGNLWVSDNQGKQWTSISSTLPPIYAIRFAK